MIIKTVNMVVFAYMKCKKFYFVIKYDSSFDKVNWVNVSFLFGVCG